MLFGLTVLLLISDVAVVARVFVNTSSLGTQTTVGEVCGIGDVGGPVGAEDGAVGRGGGSKWVRFSIVDEGGGWPGGGANVV